MPVSGSLCKKWKPRRGSPAGRKACPSKRWASTYPEAPRRSSPPYSCWAYLPVLQAVKKSCFRSEEHTSELQSRPHLVCRLLLEKKKKKKYKNMKINIYYIL